VAQHPVRGRGTSTGAVVHCHGHLPLHSNPPPRTFRYDQQWAERNRCKGMTDMRILHCVMALLHCRNLAIEWRRFEHSGKGNV
jgi:hypothetical protein